jgi:hypothetical protein
MPLPSALGAAAALVAAGAVACLPAAGAAQSLRGSPASVDRMYWQARRERLPFHASASGLRGALREGRLVRIGTTGDVLLRGVGFPYVTPATRTFVSRLGAQYRGACGERLVVTSAARPSLRQPANSVPESVHPTGMAVDLRKPSGKCLRWLRSTLLALEKAGVAEATEEFSPPHFHVAVYPTPYVRYVRGQGGKAPAAVAAAAGRGSYRVREGDTLWGIARRHAVTVERLRAANGLAGSRIRPGQTLVIPSGGAGERAAEAADGAPQ